MVLDVAADRHRDIRDMNLRGGERPMEADGVARRAKPLLPRDCRDPEFAGRPVRTQPGE